MAVWVVFPSRNPERAKEAVKLWHDKGYMVATWMEPNQSSGADLDISSKFPGYWKACNLMAIVLNQGKPTAFSRSFPPVKTIVLAADDMEPDPTHPPTEIERELYEKYPDGYVVMQPVGDDKDGMDGVHRICGSPWFGEGWIKEAFEGRGPCPLPCLNFYGDEILFDISKAQGVLWQRQDLMHYHKHWCRNGPSKVARLPYQVDNSRKFWDKDKAFYMSYKERGYPKSGRKDEAAAKRSLGPVCQYRGPSDTVAD